MLLENVEAARVRQRESRGPDRGKVKELSYPYNYCTSLFDPNWNSPVNLMHAREPGPSRIESKWKDAGQMIEWTNAARRSTSRSTGGDMFTPDAVKLRILLLPKRAPSGPQIQIPHCSLPAVDVSRPAAPTALPPAMCFEPPQVN